MPDSLIYDGGQEQFGPDQIIPKMQQYWVKTHKYRLRLPKMVKESVEIDQDNGNTLWWDAIMQEMKNVRPAFEVWEKIK